MNGNLGARFWQNWSRKFRTMGCSSSKPAINVEELEVEIRARLINEFEEVRKADAQKVADLQAELATFERQVESLTSTLEADAARQGSLKDKLAAQEKAGAEKDEKIKTLQAEIAAPLIKAEKERRAAEAEKEKRDMEAAANARKEAAAAAAAPASVAAPASAPASAPAPCELCLVDPF